MKSAELNRHLEELDHDGFTILEGVFDEELRENLKAAVDQLSVNPPEGVYNTPTGFFLGNMCEHAPEAALPAVSHPVLMELAEAIIGPFVQLDNSTLARTAGTPADQAGTRVGGWHRDRYANLLSDEMPQRPLAVAALNYLDDLDEETGPLRIIPGSHRRVFHMSGEDLTKPHPEEKLIYNRAGDVVVTRAGLVHSGTTNISDRPRFFYSVYYNHSWMRTVDDHSGPTVRAIVEQARQAGDHRLMRLLGHDEKLESKVNSGFLQPLGDQWQKWFAEDQQSLQTVS